MKILKLRASVVLRAMLSPTVLIFAVYIEENSFAVVTEHSENEILRAIPSLLARRGAAG